ncbi:SDR family oxidoreductase [Paraburkholderia acidisoli]|uniref:SDR family oxidoreductase n=1 Tax=Paraburkholderia acidisoli TaxID=2571748 RepID=A0A7Z2GQG2_9BURK|nr:SDR family oxidoreductase [Paraburkholderia acidisoli]QGZ66000.1 SDR family oxidoreductase [Paraburkholderia acidisoli]
MTQHYFITGTSSGLGRGLTERLLARGDRVAATVRQADALHELQQRYGDRLLVLQCDLTEARAVQTSVARAFEAFGHLDVIVNNAGYGLFGAAEALSDAQIRRQIDTNLLGSIAVIRAALPGLRAQRKGLIVQVSSEGGQIAYPGFSLYHATKWGIEGFVEAVAKEVAPFGIRCLIVEPGPTSTQFGAGLDHGEWSDAYDGTPVDEVRRAIEGRSGAVFAFADADKTVDAMLHAIDNEPRPLRLALGRSAYTSIRSALQARLAEVEEQEAVANSVMPESR